MAGSAKIPRFVALDGAVLPASFPELVADLEIFLGDLVVLVVIHLPDEANILGAAVEIRGDNVPGRAALGQMITRVEKRRAKSDRGVRTTPDAVSPKPRSRVTAAMGGTTWRGSLTGI